MSSQYTEFIMAEEYQVYQDGGIPQRALLPPYVYPNWMTSVNYNLYYFETPRPTLQYDNYQPNYRQMWESQDRRPQVPQARSVEETFSPRKRGRESSPRLRITVNGKQGGSQEAQRQNNYISNKRKAYSEDTRIPSDVKRVKRSNELPSGSSSYSRNHHPPQSSARKSNPARGAEDVVDKRFKKLNVEIYDYYESHTQQEVHFREKEELRRRLERGIREVCSGCHLVLVGSSLSGFGCRGSDADFCLLLTFGEVDQKNHAVHILQVIHRHLRRFSYVCKSFVIQAKVPILRFVDKITGIECDININNIIGIRNTHLMKAYSKVDWRVAPLVMWIKHWAKSNGINDASQGTLSSYSIVLLVLHYLQEICSPPVIPSLQKLYPHIFNEHRDVITIQAELEHPALHRSIDFKSENKKSLGELLAGFFSHVSNYPFRQNITSVRLGSSYKMRSDWRLQYLHIEEPFELANVARAVYRDDKYQDILRKFKQAYKILVTDPDCYLEDLLSLETETSSQSDEPPPKKKKTKRERIQEALNFLKRREKGKKTKV